MKYFDTYYRKIIDSYLKPKSIFNNGRFVPLSDEQIKFLINNPEASYLEVINEVKEEVPIQLQRDLTITHFSELSFEHVNSIISPYQVKNALTGVYDEETTPKASEVLTKYKELSRQARERFYQIEQLVLNASTPEELRQIFSSQNYYDIV